MEQPDFVCDDSITNNDLLKILKQWVGKVQAPIVTAHDVIPVIVEKSDLIVAVSERAPDEVSPWYVLEILPHGKKKKDGSRRKVLCLEINHNVY